MANENLGASFSIDITELKAGLAQANRLIRESESQFREAAAGMDDWSSSQEGLEARISSLTDQIGIQQKKVDALAAEKKRIIDTMKAEGKSNEEIERAVDSVNKSIERESKQLDRLRADLSKNQTAMADLDDTTEELSDSTEEAGRSFEGLKGAASVAVGAIGAVAGAAIAAVGAFLGLAESTREYREAQAKLNSAFEAGGHSAETAQGAYETLFGVIGEGDQAVEAAQQISMLAKSEEDVAKWAGLASGVVGQFGDALQPETFYESANETLKLGEATGAYVQMLEQKGISVDDFNKNLAKCSTEAEKQAYMLEVAEGALGEAGKAYEEAAADIIESNKATAEFEATMAELGAIAEPIMTELKKMATDLLKAITPFVKLIGEGLTGAMNGADGSAEKLAQGIGGIIDVLLNTATDMIPLLLDVVAELFPAIVSSLLEKVPMLMQFAIDAVLMVIESLTEVMPGIIAEVEKLIPEITDKLISAIPLLLTAAVELFAIIAEAIPPLLSKLAIEVPKIVTSVITSLLNNLPALIKGATTLFFGILKAIPTLLVELGKQVPTIISAIADALEDGVDSMKTAGKNLLEGIWNGISDKVEWLKGKVAGVVNKIKGWFTGSDGFDTHSPSKWSESVMQNVMDGFELGAVHYNGEDVRGLVGEMQTGMRKGIAQSGTIAHGVADSLASGNTVVVNQTNNYSQAHSRFEIYRSKQETVSAVKLALGGALG